MILQTSSWKEWLVPWTAARWRDRQGSPCPGFLWTLTLSSDEGFPTWVVQSSHAGWTSRLPYRNEYVGSHKNPFTHIHSSSIYNCQKLQAHKCSSRVNGKPIADLYSGILFSSKKEQAAVTCSTDRTAARQNHRVREQVHGCQGPGGEEGTEHGSILPDGTVLYPAGSEDNLNLCVTVHAAVHFFKSHFIAKQNTSGSWTVCQLYWSMSR